MSNLLNDLTAYRDHLACVVSVNQALDRPTALSAAKLSVTDSLLAAANAGLNWTSDQWRSAQQLQHELQQIKNKYNFVLSRRPTCRSAGPR